MRRRESLGTFGKDLWRGIVSLVMPQSYCLLCGEPFGPTDFSLEGRQICHACLERIPFVAPPMCQKCGRPLRGDDEGTRLNSDPEKPGLRGNDQGAEGDRGKKPRPRAALLCSECRRHGRIFQKARAVAVYDGIVKERIHDLKYRGALHVGEALGLLMARCLEGDLRLLASDMIVPVPLSPERMKTRGYNQSEILARSLGKVVGIGVVTDAMARGDGVMSQSLLKGNQRRRNLGDVFEVVSPSHVAGRSVLLVDDVLTTGTTANECSMALLKAGARSVSVVVAAVGILQSDWYGKNFVH